MRKILTKADLTSQPTIQEVEKLFSELEMTLGDGNNGFSLERHGPIFILAVDDDLTKLRYAYLSEGLFGTIPEEIIEVVSNGTTLYRIMFLCNNDFMPVFFVPKELIDRYPEGKTYIERWM